MKGLPIDSAQTVVHEEIFLPTGEHAAPLDINTAISPERDNRVEVIAFYLPQFHPIPENDAWWGPGFTEWTNVAKARPLFPGHYQPRIPADLGFYDLRLPETRLAQAELARNYGISAFCYWHYWFDGRRILDRPFAEVLKSGEPDFPFCLAWANQTWSGIWHGEPNRILIEQTYPGLADHERHFYTLLEAFQDDRYFTVDGKPLFSLFQPRLLPDPQRVTDFWRELAHRAGLKGLYLVGQAHGWSWVPQDAGFDASIILNMPPLLMESSWRRPWQRLRSTVRRLRDRPTIYSYRDVLDRLLAEPPDNVTSYPCVIPNWDNTPRSGANGLVLHESTPEHFRTHFRMALDRASQMPAGHRLVFAKSWNEWAEGNHLEPDRRFGLGYLQVVKDELLRVGAFQEPPGTMTAFELLRKSRSSGVGTDA